MSYVELAADIIRQFEGLRLDAYICPAGVLTCGYGHTGRDVEKGMKITKADAEAWLVLDIAEADKCLDRELRGVDLNDNQRASLISFVFNLGCYAFANSTLKRYIQGGRFMAAASEFPKWCHANGVVLPGLVRRRAAERKLFEEVV